jgi:hypothetical protein
MEQPRLVRGTAAPAKVPAGVKGTGADKETYQGRIMVALCSVSTGRANEENSSCTASFPTTPIVAVSAAARTGRK